MFKIQVSGKPREFRMLPQPTSGGATASFVLEETAFSQGKMFKRLWECYVKPHKVAWCSKMTEKSYTIIVEGEDFAVIGDTTSTQGVTRHLLMVSEIHGL